MKRLFAHSEVDGLGKVEVLGYRTNGLNEETVLVGVLLPEWQGQPIDGFCPDDLLSELEIVSTVDVILDYSEKWQLVIVLKEDLTNFHYEDMNINIIASNDLICICCEKSFKNRDYPRSHGIVIGSIESKYSYIEHKIALCDDCIEKKLENNVIKPIRNILTL